MVIRLHDYRTSSRIELDEDELQSLVADCAAQARSPLNCTTNEMVEALHHIYQQWAMPSHPMHRQYRNVGLAYLLSFIHPSSIKSLLEKGIRHKDVMDQVVDVGGYHATAVPKGLVGHWLAGNVPMLSLISVLQAMLTKNRSIVKLSSKQEDWITPFLGELARSGDAGKRMADSVVVLSYPGEWQHANAILSSLCDVRIAWGGQEAVESIAALPAKPESATLVFGPRFSCSVIDPDCMISTDWVKMARDTVLFRQLACSSPHALFIKSDYAQIETYSSMLAEAFRGLEQQAYYEPLEAGEAVKVHHYRTAAWIRGERILTSTGSQWTLHLHEAMESRLEGQGLRTLHIYPYREVTAIASVLPASIQTISHKLPVDELNRLVAAVKHAGVSRLVPLGEAHVYDIPWDGMLVLDQLVRWIRVDY